MLRALLLLLVFAAAPAAAQEYQSKELAEAAKAWRQALIDGVPAARKQPGQIAALRRTAEVEYQAKDYAAAIDKLTGAIGNGADDGLTWLRLAQSELAAGDDHAMASAYNAYLKSTDPVERGAALFVIGRDLDRHDKQKEALAAFEAGLGFTRLAAIAERAGQLRRLVVFRVTKIEVQAEANEARACLRFNEPVGTRGDIAYGAFVRSEPALDGIVTARGDTMCLDGLKHGEVYNVEILAGLPSATGEKMPATFKTRIVVPDRKKSVRFSGTGYVLPRQGNAGLPLTTVNVDKVKLRLLKVNERNLVPSIDAERLTMSFSSWSVDEIINRTGSLVWEGEMAIAGERNRPVATAIPLKDMLREKGPGIYLVVAERADLGQDESSTPATNWVLVSNLGLAAYKGADGLAVDVRSLADGKPHLRGRGPALRAQQRRARVGDERRRRHRAYSGRPPARPRRRRAVRGDRPRRRRRLQLSRNRPRRLRLERPRGRRPAAAGAGRRFSLHRPRHLPPRRDGRIDGAGARRQGRRGDRPAGRLAALAARRDRGREPPPDSRFLGRPARRPPPELRLAARRPHRRLARRIAGRPEGAAGRHRRISGRGFRPAAARGQAGRRRRADPAGRAVPGRCRGALLLRRRRGRARGRGRGAAGARRQPVPDPSGLPVRSRRGGVRRRPPRSRGPFDRRFRQGEIGGRAERSAGADPAAGGDDPGRRLRAERPRRDRNPGPADPAAPAVDRAALARRRRGGRRRQRGEGRDYRRRPARGCDRRPRAALRIAARELGIPLVFARRRLAAQSANPRPADRSGRARCRRRCAGVAGAAAARRALSLGGFRPRDRGADEPALPCRLVGRGGIAERAGQARGDPRQSELPAGRDREALRQGAVRRRGRAGDRLRPGAVAARADPAGSGHDDRDPGRCVLGRRRLCAGQRLPPDRRTGAAAARAGAGGRGRLARDRQRAAHLDAYDRRPRNRPPARPGRNRGQGGRARRRRGGLCHIGRGRRGGAEIDRVRQPGPGEILLRQAPAGGRAARPLRPADRYQRQCGRRAAQRRRQLRQALGRRAPGQEQQGRGAVLRHRPARRRRRREDPFRHPRLPGPAAADGGRLLGEKGRARRPRR